MEHGFSGGAVVVGLQPGQDPAVLACAADLAAATGAELVGAYVDPGSYLIEWDPRGNVLDQSMEHALDPDDEAASALRELRPLFVAAAEGRGLRAPRLRRPRPSQQRRRRLRPGPRRRRRCRG